MKYSKLSIIVPVFNEEKTISTILKQVQSVHIPLKKEIVVVDDYSTDETRKILKKEKNIKVVLHEKNRGKGHAIRSGLKHVTGDIIIIQDADLEYDPNDYAKLLDPILKNKTKVVYGSRFLKKHKAKYQILYIGNVVLSLLTSLMYGRRVTDMETCYKVFTKEVLKGMRLRAKRFDFEPEITAKIIKKGYTIREIPIKYKCRDYSEGKKISVKDGMLAAWYLLKYRFMN